jgi:2-polyprenyl-6-methoxyphenol hydroxylase-like FAD-dependent oxidoreductase
MSRRALVIGGSLGGLFAAHLLRRSGWHAVVFERNADDLTGRGVGLGTHPQLVTVLRRAGIAFDATMGIKVPKVVCLDRAGKVISEQPTTRTMSAWSRLYRALRSALPAQDYRLGKKLRRIEQDADNVTAMFEDGTSERGELLVGADGIRSTVREQFLPQAQPAYAGYVAWRAVLDEARVPNEARDIFELYTFCLPEGEQLLGYPVPGGDDNTSPAIAATHRLVSTGRLARARRFVHRCAGRIARRWDCTLAYSQRGDCGGQGRCAGAACAAAGRNLSTLGAVFSADFRSGITGLGLRPRGSDW